VERAEAIGRIIELLDANEESADAVVRWRPDAGADEVLAWAAATDPTSLSSPMTRTTSGGSASQVWLRILRI